MELSAIALEGLERAQEKVEQSAKRLAKAGEAASADGAPLDTVDLSTEAVGLVAARDAFALNAKLLQTAERMEKHVLDILA